MKAETPRPAPHTEGEIPPPRGAATEEVRRHLDDLTKPPGSLGRLEDLALRLAIVLGDPPPPLDERVILVMAGDHGVAAQGVSAYPSSVTRQMCLNMARGGAAISVLAGVARARVVVVDVGVTGPDPVGGGVLHRRVREGSRDLSRGPALTEAEVDAAWEVGRTEVNALDPRPDVLVLGEMGIGNTTSASALAAALSGEPASAVVGRGTGVGTEGQRRKLTAVEAGLARFRAEADTRGGAPRGDAARFAPSRDTAPSATLRATASIATRRHAARAALREVGGLELAGLAGAAIAAARSGIPVVIDGFISSVAALAAVYHDPGLSPWLFASHRSTEPGHDLVLRSLGLEPLLDLGLRLGEGTGGALALPFMECAGALLREMATFGEAGISGPDRAPP